MDSSTIPRTSGIYKITCTVTGKFYIGSAINLRMRQQTHWNTLTQGVHHNRHLQNAWNKYGLDAFTFEVLELVLLPEMLTAREQYFLDTLNPFGKRGFNIDSVAGSSLGVKRSPETNERNRQSQTGKKQSPATLEKKRQLMLGNTISRGRPPHNLGKKTPPETCEKLRAQHLGMKASPETIEKMRLAHRGQPVSAEQLAHLRAVGIKRRKTIIVTAPDGTEFAVCGINPFCREHSLSTSAIFAVIHGRRNHHKGWKARYPEKGAG